ncbi:AraC family transcriptional regulator [Chitinophaga sancti]|uniref:AraC family transcriptional regulator n=1 Tax=Chitinophaga sancti TaxID=1004 RepID=A0A1K1SL81_9BACT|nr:AraC family transcriptional regulator [Chitinophaga sancti]WQD63860.1 AraC family transcriptional regulator [Chitinophaga sancti]WQG90515.1 AraC family transcriptional regulator [Chitinophaga sancti]SFW85184.1 AraC-type DNA-binding protein [Chitinophaga sancti]
MRSYTPSTHFQYLIADDSDHLWGNVITTVGHQHIAAQEAYPPANHPARYLLSPHKGRSIEEYQLVYIVKGSGSFQSGSLKEMAVKEGNILLLFPGEWHNYYPNKETGWEEYWIGFYGTNMQSRVRCGFFDRQQPVYDIGIQDEIIQLYRKAIETAQNEVAGCQQQLSGVVSNLLGHLYSLYKSASFEQTDLTKKINQAKTILSANYNVDIPLKTVANQIQMSYSWFRHAFKECTGFSPNQYILDLRIQKSKGMLTNSILSIKEIAYEVGFNNSEYYTTLFRRKTAMTPGEYRRFTQGKMDQDKKKLTL